MLDDVVDPSPRQSRTDRGETGSPVLRHEDVRVEVAEVVAVHGHVEAVCLVGRRSDAADRGPERLERQVGLQELPGLAVVVGAGHPPVIGADVDQARDQRGFRERGEGAPVTHPVVHGEHSFGGEHPQDGKFTPVLAQREVLGGAPVAAEIVGQEQPVAAEVEAPRRVVRRGHRREPVEAVAVLVLVGEGPDGGPVPRGGVDPHWIAVLRGRQGDPGLAGNRFLVHSVAEVGLLPVAVQDPGLIAGGPPRSGCPAPRRRCCRASPCPARSRRTA